MFKTGTWYHTTALSLTVPYRLLSMHGRKEREKPQDVHVVVEIELRFADVLGIFFSFQTKKYTLTHTYTRGKAP